MYVCIKSCGFDPWGTGPGLKSCSLGWLKVLLGAYFGRVLGEVFYKGGPGLEGFFTKGGTPRAPRPWSGGSASPWFAKVWLARYPFCRLGIVGWRYLAKAGTGCLTFPMLTSFLYMA